MIVKSIKQKLMEYFMHNPTIKLRLRQIEAKTQLPFPSISRYAKELVAAKFLQVTIISGVTFYSANRSSQVYLLEKKLFNLRQSYESGLVEFLRREYSNPVIILFGSFSHGEDIEDSDIDLFIQTVSEKPFHLKQFEKKLGKTIHIFGFPSIRDIKNTHLVNNILNGIPLNGTLEFISDGGLE